MHARLLPLRDVDPVVAARWAALAARAVEPNAFFEPSVVLPAAGRLEGGADVELLLVEDGGELVLALPVHRPGSFRHVPLPSMRTWMHPYCFLGTPLLAPEQPVSAWSAALALVGDRRLAPWLALDSVDTSGPVARALRTAALWRGTTPTAFEPSERAVLRRRSSPDYLVGRVSGTSRKNLRRLRRHLDTEMGGGLHTVDRAAGDDRTFVDAVEAFLRLEESGWKGRDGGAFTRRPGHAGFFRDLCRLSRDAGTLQLWSLEAGGVPVAMKCNLVAGTTAFCFKIAYDERRARFSPGLQLELEMVDLFHADERLDVLDSCAVAGNEMANRVLPDRRPLATYLLPVHGPLGRSAARCMPVLLRTYRGYIGRLGVPAARAHAVPTPHERQP